MKYGETRKKFDESGARTKEEMYVWKHVVMKHRVYPLFDKDKSAWCISLFTYDVNDSLMDAIRSGWKSTWIHERTFYWKDFDPQ